MKDRATKLFCFDTIINDKDRVYIKFIKQCVDAWTIKGVEVKVGNYASRGWSQVAVLSRDGADVNQVLRAQAAY